MLMTMNDLWWPLSVKLKLLFYVFIQRSLGMSARKHLKCLCDSLICIHGGHPSLIFPTFSCVLRDSWTDTLQRRCSRLEIFVEDLLLFLFFFSIRVHQVKSGWFLLLKRCLRTHYQGLIDLSFAGFLSFWFFNPFVLKLIIQGSYVINVSLNEVIAGRVQALTALLITFASWIGSLWIWWLTWESLRIVIFYNSRMGSLWDDWTSMRNWLCLQSLLMH